MHGNEFTPARGSYGALALTNPSVEKRMSGGTSYTNEILCAPAFFRNVRILTTQVVSGKKKRRRKVEQSLVNTNEHSMAERGWEWGRDV